MTGSIPLPLQRAPTESAIGGESAPVRGGGAADSVLVQGVLAGDAQAGAQFAERMRCVGRFLWARSQRLGANLSRDDLLDLAQEVVARVLAKLPRYTGAAPLESWVFAFCEGELRNALRRQRRLRGAATAAVELGEVVAPGPEPAHDEVLTCLASLPAADQELLRWKHYEGLSIEAMAQRLRQKVNTVKSRYYRALLELRQRLERSRQGVAGMTPPAPAEPDRDALFTDLVAGTRDPRDPAVQEALRAPGLRAELERLAGLQRALDVGLAAVDVASAGASPIDTAVRDHVLRALQVRSAGPSGRRTLLVAAAAVLLLVAVSAALGRGRAPDVRLGPTLGLQAAPDFAEFRWTVPPSLGSPLTLAFLVRVLDLAGTELDSARTAGAAWRPSAAKRRGYPPVVLVTVDVVDQDDNPLRALGRARVDRDGRAQ